VIVIGKKFYTTAFNSAFLRKRMASVLWCFSVNPCEPNTLTINKSAVFTQQLQNVVIAPLGCWWWQWRRLRPPGWYKLFISPTRVELFWNAEKRAYLHYHRAFHQQRKLLSEAKYALALGQTHSTLAAKGKQSQA